jgi:hypothetical protein
MDSLRPGYRLVARFKEPPCPPAADHTRSPGKFAERFLADVVTNLAGQLQGFLKQAQRISPQRVVHAVMPSTESRRHDAGGTGGGKCGRLMD